MWGWLAAPIDPARAHDVGMAVAWHGRLMVLGWGVLAPLAVLIARFFKILPGQDWPVTRDSAFWWRTHWIGQSIVLGLSLAGVFLVLPGDPEGMRLHGWLGYGVMAGLFMQVALGLLRGSKGGPTAPAADGSPRGDHYDMSPRRKLFEALHKTVGYGVLGLAVAAILPGLWLANAPVWMWLVLSIWWLALIAAFLAMQRRGMAVDTYQAIWGDDPCHPGNRLPHPGWGVRRPGDDQKGESHVRHDRGNRL